MSVMTLISELSDKQIQLYLNENNELKANAPKGVLTAEIVGRMKANKPALIELLLKALTLPPTAEAAGAALAPGGEPTEGQEGFRPAAVPGSTNRSQEY